MNAPRCSKSGVSLLVVMTILSLMTVLAAAFIRVMRSAETVATGSADRSVAGGLADAALARAIEEIDATMQGVTCPYWGGMPAGADNAMSSTGAAECVDLFRGDITNLVPRALWKDAATAATNGCGWIEVPHPDGSNVLGRMAYLVVNVSGLPDVESMVLARDQAAGMVTNMVYDIGDYETFTNEASNIHRRYESVAELLALNSGVYPDASNLFVSAWRLDPDWYFEATNLLGNTGIELLPKFNLNSFTNYEASLPPGWTRYEDTSFRTNYWAGLTNRLTAAGYPESDAELLGWNIVNWLDEDSLPQGVSNAWREPIVEAVPMVNEIALREVHGGSNEYEFVVETWYPFAPTTNAGFSLHVGVFKSELPGGVAVEDVMDGEYTNWSFTVGLPNMYPEPGFHCATSPVISFKNTTTNVPPITHSLPIGGTNKVWFLARVLNDAGEPVDEAMGYAPGSDPALSLMEFSTTAVYAVSSPFLNGRKDYWEKVPDATLGTTNANCDPWVNGGAGLPIVHRDGPMMAVGELGYVMMPTNGAGWRDVDLVSSNGAALVDRFVARTGTDHTGLFHPGCAPRDVIEALFIGSQLGVATGGIAMIEALEPPPDFAAIFGEGFVVEQASDVLAVLGSDTAYAEWPPDGVHTTGNYKEDAVRYIAEAFAFRKNTFIVVYSGQALTPNGRGVRATARGVAYVCRDSYTGRCTVLLRRGLLD
ncbi:MAG: hypothetical protein FJ224_09620 [Lentisphaerae bacterium]|nr:hypothetical protein [Lentisphaerota bacterium]